MITLMDKAYGMLYIIEQNGTNVIITPHFFKYKAYITFCSKQIN